MHVDWSPLQRAVLAEIKIPLLVLRDQSAAEVPEPAPLGEATARQRTALAVDQPDQPFNWFRQMRLWLGSPGLELIQSGSGHGVRLADGELLPINAARVSAADKRKLYLAMRSQRKPQ